MFLYKNPGIKKMLRFKLHSWGVQTLEGIIKKEDELKEKLRESIRERTEALIEKKDKLVHEMENKFNQKKAEL
jgi:flagellar capping protein FliD